MGNMTFMSVSYTHLDVYKRQGLGSAIDALKSDDPAAGYGATYPFALLGMVIFTIVLHTLPM